MRKDKKNELKAMFLIKLKNTLGNISEACRGIGIDRNTYYNWFHSDEKFKEACDIIGEETIDIAESALMKQIQDGNTTAIIFYLKTKGKERGYVESKRIEADTNLNIDGKLPPINLELVGGDDE